MFHVGKILAVNVSVYKAIMLKILKNVFNLFQN